MKTELHLLDVSETRSALSDDFETQSIGSQSFVYNEMSDFPLSKKSEIEQLKENALVLKDLNERLGFLSKEIRYLLNIK